MSQDPLPRLDFLVFFSGLRGTIFGVIKTQNCLFLPSPPLFFFLTRKREEVRWTSPNLLKLLLLAWAHIYAPRSRALGGQEDMHVWELALLELMFSPP